MCDLLYLAGLLHPHPTTSYFMKSCPIFQAQLKGHHLQGNNMVKAKEGGWQHLRESNKRYRLSLKNAHKYIQSCASDFRGWGHLKPGSIPPMEWSKKNRVIESVRFEFTSWLCHLLTHGVTLNKWFNFFASQFLHLGNEVDHSYLLSPKSEDQIMITYLLTGSAPDDQYL